MFSCLCGQRNQLSSMMSSLVEEVMCVPWYCDGEYDILNIIMLPIYLGSAYCRSDFFHFI